MSVLDVIRTRFSVRRYSAAPIEERELETVLEAARLSPSAKNRQDWRFIVVRNGETRRKLAEAAKGQSFVAEAPVVIVCCGVDIGYIMTCGQPGYAIDVAIAMENMALVAWELGLGACWLGAFWEDRVKTILGIPEENVRVVGMLTLGR
ncbi:MAG: nitroreductase family protein, partial [Candidatus Latescibacterota bacterium]